MADGVLTTRRAALYCGLAYGTFRNLIASGDGPKRYKHGRLNAFYPSDLDAWLRYRLQPVGSNRSPGGSDASL